MANLVCQLRETVVLRDHNLVIQLAGLGDQSAEFSVRPASAGTAADPIVSDRAARRMVRDELKSRAHRAAEILHALHEQLERDRQSDVEPLIMGIYRQLRDMDRQLEAYLGEPDRPAHSHCPDTSFGYQD